MTWPLDTVSPVHSNILLPVTWPNIFLKVLSPSHLIRIRIHLKCIITPSCKMSATLVTDSSALVNFQRNHHCEHQQYKTAAMCQWTVIAVILVTLLLLVYKYTVNAIHTHSGEAKLLNLTQTSNANRFSFPYDFCATFACIMTRI